MPKQLSKQQLQSVNKVYSTLALVAAVLLLLVGFLATWAASFTTDMVRTELAAQKIYFPEKGSPALDPAKYPDLQKYAGQLVDTAPEARAYANGYIGAHLKDIAGGKVYSEVSAEQRKNPTDPVLAAQKQQLFMGETLRGILLGTGYAYGTMGQIASIAAGVSYAGSVLLLGLGLVLGKKARA